MTADLAELRAGYVDKVDPDCAVDPVWRAALRAVPRDVFVPFFYVSRTDRPGWRVVAAPKPEWAQAVFSNRSLITQLDGRDDTTEAIQGGDTVDGRSTSSSSQPSLMALMLHALDVRPGHRVMEIGTGTGYNAALLCHRLDAENVTTLDVDSAITGRARSRLATLGYEPAVLTVDGLNGCPERAPFDRIIATVAIPRVPHTWIQQTGVGGKILFPLDRRNCGGIMPLLTVTSDRAEGRFLDDYGGFMPTRHHPRYDAAVRAFQEIHDHQGTQRVTQLNHDIATDSAHPFEFLAALFTGGYDQMSFTPNGGGPIETWLATDDGSWACHTTNSGTHHVCQGGPHRLWDRIEELHARWNHLGCPTRDRFGLTVTNTEHTIWLDQPDGEHRWPLT